MTTIDDKFWNMIQLMTQHYLCQELITDDTANDSNRKLMTIDDKQLSPRFLQRQITAHDNS